MLQLSSTYCFTVYKFHANYLDMNYHCVVCGEKAFTCSLVSWHFCNNQGMKKGILWNLYCICCCFNHTISWTGVDILTIFILWGPKIYNLYDLICCRPSEVEAKPQAKRQHRSLDRWTFNTSYTVIMDSYCFKGKILILFYILFQVIPTNLITETVQKCDVFWVEFEHNLQHSFW